MIGGQTGLVSRTQRYADRGDTCAFYEALKAVYALSHQIRDPLRSSDGNTLLTDKEAILQRWSEHFRASLVADVLCRSLYWPGFPKWT